MEGPKSTKLSHPSFFEHGHGAENPAEMSWVSEQEIERRGQIHDEAEEEKRKS